MASLQENILFLAKRIGQMQDTIDAQQKRIEALEAKEAKRAEYDAASASPIQRKLGCFET